MSQEKLEKIDLWVTQATREIELSEPGTDRSQFPLRDLFSSIAEKSEGLEGLEEFHKCAVHTNALIEEILFSGENYTADQLAALAGLAAQLTSLRAEETTVFVEPASEASEVADVNGAPAEDLEKIDNWISQASREILLSEPGTDRSQFPLRDLFSSIAEKSEGLEGLEEFHKCAVHTNALIEEILFSGQNYTEAQLETLGALATQLEELRSGSITKFTAPAAAGASTPAEISLEVPADSESAPEADDEFTSIDIEADGDILHEFSNEAREHLDNIEQGILVLEDQPDDAAMLSSIFRAFHTFKGASGFLRLMPVNRLSHELENLLDLARSGKLVLNPFVIDLILEGRDVLKNFTDELQLQLSGEKPVVPIHVPVNKLVVRVKAVIENPQEIPSAPEAERDEEPSPAESPKQATAGSGVKAVSTMMKVDTRKFDSLVELVGELVIAQSQVSQHPDLANLHSQQLTRNLSQLSQIALELQKIAMSLRMVAIKGTFQKMIRLVRDLNASTGKSVDLVIRGEDTEMDRTMVEELADPLMHMIRNSVDHGIETNEKRLEAGKSEKGIVRLSAFHQGGSIVVEIADDGAGLNTKRIFDKAVERGIVTADASLSDKEIFDLIFAPGFSTAEKITGISGRGVGMDVVKQNIAKMRGKIEIDSVPGKGTTFRIFLPLTLAIIDGLIARVGEERYIFPTLSVCESFRPKPEMITTIQGKGEVVKVRDRLCPILRLYNHFKITPRSTDPCESLLIVVESAGQRRCIMVDELIGKQEVVIKSLDERFKSNKCVAGAAILGDGLVGLILDPRELVQTGGRNTQGPQA